MALPLAAQLAMVAVPSIMGYLSGNKKDAMMEDLIKQLEQDSKNAYNEQLGVVNSAYQQAQNKAYTNLAKAGLGNTGIANTTLSGMTQQRGMALSQAKANAANQRRQNQALMSQLLNNYDDGSGMWGQLAGYALSGTMQGMFNQGNPATDWKKIFENMFQTNQLNNVINSAGAGNPNVYNNTYRWG